MFMGTGSDVGKSLMVAGLCRHFTQQGLCVRPFKPQNMSNNAAVTTDGGEIGRAQALQARACKVSPSVHMNPVLLKPQSEIGSQVVVQGKMWGTAKAAEYQQIKGQLMPAVLESFEILKSEADLILVEGAGSASEVNLRQGDIANWGFACVAQVPTILIGDIDRGGVIASLIGTHALLSDQERTLLKGFIINKFRGDTQLFSEAMKRIEAETGMPGFGIAPYFFAAHKLPAEDALALDQQPEVGTGLKIIVLRTPRISNFDDLDPLALEPNVNVQFLQGGQALPGDADLVILAGSKATLADLAFVREQGWDIDLRAHVRRGGRVLGLCGGYQMLGKTLSDPHGIEGAPATMPGLGLLDVETVMTPEKALVEVCGTHLATDMPLSGYEMHIGQTHGADCARPVLDLAGRPDGASSANGQVSGTYVHGLFASDGFRSAFLRHLDARPSALVYEQQIEETLDALAEHLAVNLDMQGLLALTAEDFRA